MTRYGRWLGVVLGVVFVVGCDDETKTEVEDAVVDASLDARVRDAMPGPPWGEGERPAEVVYDSVSLLLARVVLAVDVSAGMARCVGGGAPPCAAPDAVRADVVRAFVDLVAERTDLAIGAVFFAERVRGVVPIGADARHRTAVSVEAARLQPGAGSNYAVGLARALELVEADPDTSKAYVFLVSAVAPDAGDHVAAAMAVRDADIDLLTVAVLPDDADDLEAMLAVASDPNLALRADARQAINLARNVVGELRCLVGPTPRRADERLEVALLATDGTEQALEEVADIAGLRTHDADLVFLYGPDGERLRLSRLACEAILEQDARVRVRFVPRAP